MLFSYCNSVVLLHVTLSVGICMCMLIRTCSITPPCGVSINLYWQCVHKYGEGSNLCERYGLPFPAEFMKPKSDDIIGGTEVIIGKSGTCV